MEILGGAQTGIIAGIVALLVFVTFFANRFVSS